MGGTGSARRLEKQEADHAGANDEDGIASMHGRDTDAMQGDGDRLQHGCLREG